MFARGGPARRDGRAGRGGQGNGGEIRTAARVAHVRRRDDQAVGVTLESGEEIDAPVVVSGLDPQTTLLDLLEPEVLGPRLSWRAGNIRQNGATARVSYALRALPVFPAAYDDAARLRGRIIIAPSMRYLDLATRPARYGQTADRAAARADHPVADRRQPCSWSGHVMTVVAQAVAHGRRRRQRRRHGDRERSSSTRRASAELIAERAVLTPLRHRA